jgi:hypothetical protein
MGKQSFLRFFVGFLQYGIIITVYFKIMIGRCIIKIPTDGYLVKVVRYLDIRNRQRIQDSLSR